MKVLITGGHVTPALAVIDELSKKNHEIYFVGRKSVNTHEKKESFEYKEILSRKIPFFPLNSGRLQRSLSLDTLTQLGYFFTALGRSFGIIGKIKPDVIISFGGYVAVPIAFAGWARGIKIITHEQTISPGIANKIIGFFSRKVCVSFPETANHFGSKTILTGNPLRREFFMEGKAVVASKSRPILYISGGSLGSHAINIAIEKVLPQLLTKFIVIHQTGNIQEFGDFERLSRNVNEHYIVREHFTAEEVSWLFKNADVMISRSGANTFFEIILSQLPAILVPLPISGGGEQQKHAELLKKNRAAEIWQQSEEVDLLLNLITKVYSEKEHYKSKLLSLRHYIKPDAAIKIVEMAVVEN